MSLEAHKLGAGTMWKGAAASDFKTIYIEYQDRRGGRSAMLQAEFFHLFYESGHAMITLCCPLCMKGTVEDVPADAEGPVSSRALKIRQEVKPFAVDSNGRLTVHEPIACTYCGQWSVKIKNGIAYDCAG